MNANQQIRGLGRRLLNELRDHKRANGSRRARVQQGNVEVEVEVSDLDRLSLASHQLTVRRTDGQPPRELPVSEAIRGQVQRLPRQLQYLPEPLSPVEVDERLAGATLRSAPPTEDADGVRFYEVTLRDGQELALTRWETRRENNWRRQSDFALTHDIFTRLVDDLAELIA